MERDDPDFYTKVFKCQHHTLGNLVNTFFLTNREKIFLISFADLFCCWDIISCLLVCLHK